jgi:hypothetical protein
MAGRNATCGVIRFAPKQGWQNLLISGLTVTAPQTLAWLDCICGVGVRR